MRLPVGIRRYVQNSGFALFGYVTTTLIAFGYAVVLARVLGKHDYGILAFGFAWYLTFIAFSYLGLDVVLSREIGRDRGAAARLAGSTLALRVAAALLCGAASSVVGALISTDRVTRTILALFGISLLARAVWVWCGSIFTAFEDTRYLLYGDLICRPLEPAVAGIVLVVFPHSVVAVAVVHVTVWSLQAALGLAFVLGRMTAIDTSAVRADAARMLREGFPGWVYTITALWFVQVPIVLYRAAGGTRELGAFALAMQIIGYLLTVPYLAGSIALPLLARSAARGDGKTRTAARVTLVGIPLVGVVMGLLTWALAPALTRLIFGTAYHQTGTILTEAIWLVIPMSVAVGMQQIGFSTHRSSRLASASAMGGVALMAALFVPMTHRWGFHGSLVATGAGMTLWAGGAVRSAFRGLSAARSDLAPQEASTHDGNATLLD